MASSLQTLTKLSYSMQQSLETDFDLNDVETKAQKLAKEGNKLVQNEVAGQSLQFIPLPVVLKTITTLAQDSIQYCDKTKYHLSKVSRIFMELVFFQTFTAQKGIYSATKKDIIDQLEKVKSTLPETEVATEFEVECCIAAANVIQPGKGLFREMLKDLGANLATGTFSAVASLSPGDVVAPLVDFLKRAYQEKGASWFPDVWSMRWKLTNLVQKKDFEALLQDIGNIKAIEKHGKHFSFCLAESFMEIIENSNAETSLKGRVFDGIDTNNPGLLQLADLKDDFWKTRYRVVEHLNSLSKQSEYQTKVIEKLSSRLAIEKSAPVAKLLNVVYQSSSEEEKKIWQTQFRRNASSKLSGLAEETKKTIVEIEEKAKEQNAQIKSLQTPPVTNFLQSSDSEFYESDNKEEIEKLIQENLELEKEVDGLKSYQDNLNLIQQFV